MFLKVNFVLMSSQDIYYSKGPGKNSHNLEVSFFPVSELFISGDQSTVVSASASVLQMNIQG